MNQRKLIKLNRFIAFMMAVLIAIMDINISELVAWATEGDEYVYLLIGDNKIKVDDIDAPLEFNYGYDFYNDLKIVDYNKKRMEGYNISLTLEGGGESFDVAADTKLAVGTYRALVYSDIYESDSFTIKVNKSNVAAPSSASFVGGKLTFDAVTKNAEGYALDDSVLDGYVVTLKKDGAVLKEIDTSLTTVDLSTELIDNGKAVYSVAVAAKLKAAASDRYNGANSTTDIGRVYVVDVRNGEAGTLLIAGNTEKNSHTFSVEAQTGYEFTGFNSIVGVTLSNLDIENNLQKVTLNDDYNGETTISLTPKFVDNTAPREVAIVAGTGDNRGKFVGNANDNETGIAAYAFTTVSNSANVSWIEVAEEEISSGTFSKVYTPTEPGKYYFYVKDKDGNIARSESYLGATKVNYVGYYNEGEQVNDYSVLHIGNEALAVANRPGYTFHGWFKDSSYEQVMDTSIDSVLLGGESTAYCYWTRNETSFKTQPVYSRRSYNGENVVLTVELNNTSGIIEYQWYKDNEPIEGAVTPSYTVGKNAGSYGSFYAIASVTLDGVKKSAQSDTVEVEIDKATLTITPEDKVITYGDDYSDDDLLYEITGYVGDENASNITLGTVSASEYEGNAGEYDIKFSGFVAINYTFYYGTAKLTVNAKNISDLVFKGIDPDGYTYDGEAKEPVITVNNGDIELVKTEDYTVLYSANVNAGTATATITGINNYTGTKDITFTIKKASFVANVSRNNYTYGETPSEKILDTNNSGGLVTYYYRKQGEDLFTSIEPTAAGDYEFYAIIEQTSNYLRCTTAVATYKISKATITISSPDGTWRYDGNPHISNTYEVEGDFVGTDSFKSITVTGTITDVAESPKENTITYVLSAKNPENYNIVLNPGELSITSSPLVSPSTYGWSDQKPGEATWVAVVRTGLLIRYELELYRVEKIDGELVHTKIGDSISTAVGATSYDFSSTIRSDAAAHNSEGYVYRIKSVRCDEEIEGNENISNYTDSPFSLMTEKKIFAVKVNVTHNDGVLGAFIAGETSKVVIAGESMNITSSTNMGYMFNDIVWTTPDGVSVGSFADSRQHNTMFLVASSIAKNHSITIHASAVDEPPVISAFGAEPVEGNKKIRLNLSASDSLGITKWVITTNENVTSLDDIDNWNEVDSLTSIEKNIVVENQGNYYAYVVDTAGTIVRWKDSVSLYSVSFAPGDGQGAMETLLKIKNVALRLPHNTFTKNGYGFKNWCGTRGDLYSDEGDYGFNASTTLTAQWTDTKYSYTVEYYLMDTEGNYGSCNESKGYIGQYNATITPTNQDIAKAYVGMMLDEAKNTNLVITQDNLVLKIYYKRLKYRVTYSYRVPGDNEDTVVTNEYYYGETTTEEPKPNEGGYYFRGWEYEGYGALPDTMPNKNITATGSFEPYASNYRINFYTKNLEGEAYTLYMYTTVNATHGDIIAADGTNAISIMGFKSPKVTITNGTVGGANPQNLLTSANGMVTAVENQTLNINYYYEREIYTLTLNVYRSNAEIIYTNNWSIPFGTAITPSDYETHDQESWYPTATADGMSLANYCDWSCGLAPSTMPAGDVTVRREYIYRTHDASYGIKIFVEKINPETGEFDGYDEAYSIYYASTEGAIRTIGMNSGYWTIENFKNCIPNYEYYKFAETPQGGFTNNLSITVSKNETRLLKVYLDRLERNVSITYKRVTEDGEVEISSDSYKAKWGTIYRFDPLKYYNEDYDTYGKCAVYYSGYYWINSESDIASPNGGKLCTVGTNQYWPSHIYTGINDDINTWDPVMLVGQLTNNSMTIWYSDMNPARQYKVNININDNLKATPNAVAPIMIEYNGNSYKLASRNEAYFYSDATFVEAAESGDYFASRIINGYYAYDKDNGTLKDGVSKVSIEISPGNTFTYYIEGEYIYIPNTSNTYFQGRRASYSASSTQSNINYIGYKEAAKYLANYKATYTEVDDAQINAAYVYNTGSTWTFTGDVNHNIYFEYRPIYQLTYTVEGIMCPSRSDSNYHKHAYGDVITPECNHGGFEDRRSQGYSIIWYNKTYFNKDNRIGSTYTVTGNATLYGRYEKTIHNSHKYVHYELADAIELGNGDVIEYVTKDNVEELVEAGIIETNVSSRDISFRDEFFTSTKQVVTTTYTLVEGGDVVLIDIAFPVLALQTVSFLEYDVLTGVDGYNAYKISGYSYDETNVNNRLIAYCQNNPALLSVYFSRTEYELTVDKADTLVSNPVTTRNNFGHHIVLPKPVKEGYDFAGWKFEHMNASNELEEFVMSYDEDGEGNVTIAMPEKNVWATAQWTLGQYNQSVIHYFQKSDKSYGIAELAAMRATSNTSPINFVYESVVSGTLYKDDEENILGVSYSKTVGGKSYIYYFSCNDDDEIVVEDSDIIAIVVTELFDTESSVAVSSMVMNNFDIFNFDYAMYRYLSDIKSLTSGENFSTYVGMSLECYYSRISNLDVDTYIAVIDGGELITSDVSASATLSGNGTYSYSENITLNAVVNKGYTFIGWAKKSDVIENNALKSGYESKILSSDNQYHFRVKAGDTYVAIISADDVEKPTISLEGIESLVYGYEESSDNYINISVDMAGLDESTFVAGYQWYKEGELIPAATSATYIVPIGLNAGAHNYMCKVTVGRKDNNKQMVMDSVTKTITVAKSAMTVKKSDYSGVYDGLKHGVTVDVMVPASSSDYDIYYSDKPLDASNYSTAGSTDINVHNAYADVKYNTATSEVESYTVYYYVKSKSKNYLDASGVGTVYIEPKVLVLKSQASENGVYKKVYDGKTTIEGDIYDVSSDKGRLSQGGYFKIDGVAGVDSIILGFNAELDNAHKEKATAVKLTNIRVYFKNIEGFEEGEDTRNYNYEFKADFDITLSAEVTPFVIENQWDEDTNYVYDASEHVPGMNIINQSSIPVMDRDNILVKVTGAQKNVGTYNGTAVVELKDGAVGTYTGDYKFSSANKQYKIAQKNIYVEPIAENITYDGSNHTLSSFEVKTLEEGHKATAVIDTKYTDCGEYDIAAHDLEVLDENNRDVTYNYNISYPTAKLIIKPKKIIISGIKAKNKSFDNENTVILDYSDATISGLIDSDEESVLIDSSKITARFDDVNAGDNKNVTITIASNAIKGARATNYVVDVENSIKQAKAKISPIDVTITPSNKSVTYGNSVTFEATFTGNLEDDREAIETALGNVTYTIKKVDEADSYEYAYAVTTPVGTYVIIADVSALASDDTVNNYSFVANEGTLTVNKRDISVASSNKATSKVYDALTKTTGTTAQIQRDNYEFTNVVNGDSVSLKSFTASYDKKDIDATKIIVANAVLDDSSAKNYNLINTSFDVAASISRKALTVTAEDKEIKYGDAAPTYTASFVGFAGSESESVLTGTAQFSCDYDVSVPANKVVGTYTIVPSGYGMTNGNYSIIYDDGTLEVKKAMITLAATTTDADDKIIYKIDSIPDVDYTVSGLKYSEVLDDIATGGGATVAYSPTIPTATSAAGEYPVVFTTKNYEATNYDFTYLNGKLIIEKHELTIEGITVDGKVFDGTTNVDIDNKVNTTAVTYTGILPADEANKGIVMLAAEYVPNANAGDGKTVNVTYKLNDYLAARYTIKSDSQKSATADITKKPVIVKPSTKTVKYGDAAPAFTYIVDGLVTVNEEILNDITGTANYTCSYTNTSDVGSYLIAMNTSTLTSDNYSISYGTNTLTVQKTALSAPEPTWDTTTVGKVKWNVVSGIGNVEVDRYEVKVYKNDVLVKTDETTNNYYELASYIRTEGLAGKYVVKVKAVASLTNNVANGNVDDSAYGTSAEKYAAKATFKYATSDADTNAAKNTININSAANYIVIAGDTEVSIGADLQNATGYLLNTVTSSSTFVTVAGSLTGGTYSGTIAVANTLASSDNIDITLSVKARLATLVTSVVITDNDEVEYGYTALEAPNFKVTAGVGAGDNIVESGYTYSYRWTYKLGERGSETEFATKDASGTTIDTSILPTGVSRHNKCIVTCYVTATRTDNNKTASTSAAVNFEIKRAGYTANMVMTGWTYGQSRVQPSVAHNSTEVPSETYYYSTSSLTSEGTWTKWDDTHQPSDIGTWYVYAVLGETQSYKSIATAPVSFTITANKLAAPTGLLSLGDSNKAPYGTAVWNAVTPPKENNNISPASSVSVSYKVYLYKYGEEETISDATLVGTYGPCTATSLNIVDGITTPGYYVYKVEAIATSSNSYKNCEDSDLSAFSEALHVGADVTVTDNGVTKLGDSYTKVYDGKTVVITTDATGTYQWYENGQIMPGETQSFLELKNVVEGYYSCKVTYLGNQFDTTYKYIKITPRPITVTSANASKTYDGTALTNYKCTLTDGTSIDYTSIDANICKIEDSITGDTVYVTVTGSIINKGNTANTISSVVVKNGATAVTSNYTITKTQGTLAISAKSLGTGETYGGNIVVEDIDAVTYNGTAHEPGVTVIYSPDGLTSISLVATSDYTVGYSNNLHNGTATITITGKGNYSGSITKNFTINKREITLTSASLTKVYDKTALISSGVSNVSITSGSLATSETISSVSYTASITNVGEIANTFDNVVIKRGDDVVTDDYNITKVETGKLSVTKRPVLVVPDSKTKIYGTTDPIFTYVTKAIVDNEKSGLIEGDSIDVLLSRVEGENVGEYSISASAVATNNNNYDISFDNTQSKLTITNASQAAPELGKVDETIDGKADGKITSLTTAMEYRVLGTTDFIAVTDVDMELSVGTYEVRYMAKANYNASPVTSVTIGAGRKLTVTTEPVASQVGYTIETSATESIWNGSATLTYVLKPGYSETDSFAIKVNGVAVNATLVNGKRTYVIENIEDDKVVTVVGVADITAPTGTIKVKNDTWNNLLTSPNFNIFYKETQTALITASDIGSGVDTIEYYVDDKMLSVAELDEVSTWTPYPLVGVSLTATNDYIVYAKLTDNAGNVAYISTNVVTEYKDSAAATTLVDYTKLEMVSKDATVTLNGNAINKLSVDGMVLTREVDYSVGGDKITFTSSYLEGLSAGEYTVTVYYNPNGHTYVEGGDNQAPLTTNFKIKVAKTNATITNIDDCGKTYDGNEITNPHFIIAGEDGKTAPSGSVTYEYKKKTDADTEYSDIKPVDVGEYTVRVSVAADGNYNGVTATKDFVISPKAVTVVYSTPEKIYDGNTDAEVTGTVTTGVDGESITVSGFVSAYDNKNAGTGKSVTVDSSSAVATAGAGTSLANYKITYPTTTTGKITVKNIGVIYSTPSKIYDGSTDAEVTGTAIGLNGDTFVITGLIGTFDNKNVGIGKTVTVNYDNAIAQETGTAILANYKISYETTQNTTTGTIIAKDVTVVYDEVSKTYDGNVIATVTGTVNTGIADEHLEVTGFVGIYDDKNANDGKIVMVDSANAVVTVKEGNSTIASNYNVVYPTMTTGKIKKKTLNVTYNNPSKVYDGNTKALVQGMVVTGIDGEAITITGLKGAYTTAIVGNGKTVNVDSVGAIATPDEGTSLDNYTIVYPITTTGKITNLAVTASYGEVTKIYDGNSVAASVPATVTVDGNVITITGIIGTYDSKDAGNGKSVAVNSIMATMSASDAALLQNYTIIYPETINDGIITPKEVIATYNTPSKVFDKNVQANGLVAVTVDTGITGEAITVNNLSGTFDNENAGANKTITVDSSNAVEVAGEGTNLENYRITYPSTTSGQIFVKIITAEYNTPSKTYDGNVEAEITAIATGIDGDAFVITGLTGSYVNKDVGEIKSVVVNYENAQIIQEANANSANYMIAYPEITIGKIIPKDISVIANNVLKVYGEVDPELTYVINGIVAADSLTGIKIERAGKNTVDGENVGSYDITVSQEAGENANYNITFVGATFTITKANQNAPEVVAINETIKYKADGHIGAITTAMEYRVNGQEMFVPVMDTNMNLAAGTYEVRYAEDNNHKQSPITQVTIGEGRYLKVEIPEQATQIGYIISQNTTQVPWHGDATITYEIKPGYSETETFAIKVNGVAVETEPVNGKRVYVIENAETDMVVTVEGVADVTAPIGAITIKDDSWSNMVTDVTFEIFYKESQVVGIIAADEGSGLDKIEYLVANNKLSALELDTIESWEPYVGEFSINPVDKYVVYAKLRDKAGNVRYISSDGVVIDNIAPVITGIENGGIYCEDVTVEVADPFLYEVKLDGENVTLSNNSFVVPADKLTHHVVATDLLGNESATYEFTMGHKYGEATFIWTEDLASVFAEFVCEYDETHKHTEELVIDYTEEAPDCVTLGNKHYEASVTFEGVTYSDEKNIAIAKLPHSYTEWETVTPPTYTENGLMRRHCVMCNIPQTKDIPKLEYDSHLGQISGIIAGDDSDKLYDVTIDKGSTIIQKITGVHVGERFVFGNLPNGEYNLVITSNDYTVTSMATISDATHVDKTVNAIGNELSKVEVLDAEAPDVAADGLQELYKTDVIAKDSELIEAITNGGNVKIQLEVSKTEDKLSIDLINEKAKELEKEIGMLFDLDLYMYLTSASGDVKNKIIKETDKYILVAVPIDAELVAKSGIGVIRVHDGKVNVLPAIDTKVDEPIEECFYVSESYAYIWANRFSSYAITYDKIEETSIPSNNNSVNPSAPKPIGTGDSSNVSWYFTLLLLSGLCVFEMKRRKHNRG